MVQPEARYGNEYGRLQVSSESRSSERDTRSGLDRTLSHQQRGLEIDPGFLQFFYATRTPMWLYDPDDLSILMVNDAACEMYGFGRAEFLLKNLLDIQPLEDRLLLESAKGLTGGRGHNPRVWKHVCKSGEILFVEVDATRVWADGRPVVVTTIHNASKRRKAETDLASLLKGARCLLWEAEVWPLSDGTLAWDIEFPNAEAAMQFFPIEIKPGMLFADAFDLAKLPEDQPAMRLVHRSELENGLKAYHQEYRIRLADGHVRWLGEGVTIEPAGRDRWYLTGVCVDVTERRKAQDEMAHIINTARCLLWQADVIEMPGYLEWHTEVENSEAGVRFLPLDTSNGRSYSEMFHLSKLPEDLDEINDRSSRAILEGRSGYQQEFRVRDANGQVRWLSEDVAIEPAGPGRWRVTGACADITALKTVQIEVQHVLQSARCLLWQATVRDVEGELDWDLKFRNPEAATQFLPVSIPPGSSFADVFYSSRPLDQDEKMNLLSDMAIRQGWPGYQQEFSIRMPDGEAKWLAEDVSIEQIGERSWSLIGICTDITERKRAEEIMLQAQVELEERVRERTRELELANEALLRAKEEAERANLAKSTFLSRTSHELRTPLNAVLGFGQLLERQKLTPGQHESVKHILKGGRHLLGLINEILDLAKVESGRTEIHLESVPVCDVYAECCDLLRSLAEECDVSLKWVCARSQACVAVADRQRLRQVLINLVANGIKYNRPGGSVELTCSIKGGTISLAVRDTGIGIGDSDLEKLFRPFERLGAAATGIEGTGLGLTLSQKLVMSMGGKIHVESAPGAGSTFAVELPRATGPGLRLESASLNADVPDPQPVRSSTVLVIEDNPANLRLVESALADRPEIKVFSSLQGAAGLELAKRVRPDVILLDLNLPDIPGSQVLEQVKRGARTSRIPVILMSADATAGRMEELMRAGASAYVTKPIDLCEFKATLDKVLAS